MPDPDFPGARYWIAFHYDWSGFAIFQSELESLRYAVEHSMQVAEIETGKDVRQQVSG